MMMSVDVCLSCFRKCMIAELGRDRANLALERMRDKITKAKQAEDAGRIKDMQPLFALPNMDGAKVAEGWFFLEIRYREVVGEFKGDLKSWVTPVLTPDDFPKPEPDLLAIMSAG